MSKFEWHSKDTVRVNKYDREGTIKETDDVKETAYVDFGSWGTWIPYNELRYVAEHSN